MVGHAAIFTADGVEGMHRLCLSLRLAGLRCRCLGCSRSLWLFGLCRSAGCAVLTVLLAPLVRRSFSISFASLVFLSFFRVFLIGTALTGQFQIYFSKR